MSDFPKHDFPVNNAMISHWCNICTAVPSLLTLLQRYILLLSACDIISLVMIGLRFTNPLAFYTDMTSQQGYSKGGSPIIPKFFYIHFSVVS